MSHLSILLIDNNRPRLQSLSLLLQFMNFDVNSQTQFDAIDANTPLPDLIIFGDKNLTHFLPVLSSLTKTFPQIPFILLKNTENIPFDTIKQQYPLCLGGFEEPFKQDALLELVEELFSQNGNNNNQATNNYIVDKKSPSESDNKSDVSILPVDSYLEANFIGQSEAIQQVKKLIQQVALSNANVLILGESGTGKEVVASCIHMLSKRKEKSYVPVNCGAIPADLLESELFGHEKGAFTGAISARQGRFELAQEGTLFLDEIGDMPLAMQVKLLRVLQEKRFERVGGIKSMDADVRVLAATHRNLEEQVESGSFREDLFYRLNVFPIEIPSLRERVSDLPLLIELFNKQVEYEQGERVSLSKEAMASLFMHNWPGNVRELGNLIERLSIIFCSDEISYDDLPDKYKYDISDFDFEQLNHLEQNIQTLNDEGSSEEAEFDDQTIIESDKQDDDKLIDSQAEKYSVHEEGKTTTSDISLLEDEEFDLKEHLSHLEQNLIQDALNKSNGVVAHAAKRLNIRRTTLVEKMRKYEI